jgi:hypothetical protein
MIYKEFLGKFNNKNVYFCYTNDINEAYENQIYSWWEIDGVKTIDVNEFINEFFQSIQKEEINLEKYLEKFDYEKWNKKILIEQYKNIINEFENFKKTYILQSKPFILENIEKEIEQYKKFVEENDR